MKSKINMKQVLGFALSLLVVVWISSGQLSANTSAVDKSIDKTNAAEQKCGGESKKKAEKADDKTGKCGDDAKKAKEVKDKAGKCGEGKCGGDKAKAVKTDYFKVMDADNDGAVSKDEFAAHAASEYAKKDEDNDGKLKSGECKMFDKFNEDDNDFLSKDEFVKGHEMMFGKIDSDKNGSISKGELEAFHKSMMKSGKCGEGKKAEKKAEMKCGEGKCGSDK